MPQSGTLSRVPSAQLWRGAVPRPDLDLPQRAQAAGGRSLAFPPPVPPPLPTPPSSYERVLRSLLRHATHGFSLPDFWELRSMGWENWLDWQLDHENIDDSVVDSALAGFPTLTMTTPELWANYEFDAATVVYELQQAEQLRAIYSRKQLYERMVEFWTDHFSINQLDDFCLWFKTRDDYRVIRQHALGSFPEMLKTSPKSAAMLWYLDNWNNIAGSIQENYGRELLELHTLGVNGPYTETDVKEVARCFTGWTFHGVYTNGPFGKFVYLNQLHDQGQKTVLGNVIPPSGGMADGEAVLDILANHPATAEFISTKMARWLLGYEPPQDLIQRLVTIYLSTAGSIKPMVREILRPGVLGRTPVAERRKHKRPHNYVTSVMRAAQVPSTNLLYMTIELLAMGHVPYWYATPDGYPDSLDAWGKALLPRWDFASRLFSFEIPENYPDMAVLKDLMKTAPPGWNTAQQIDWVLTGGDTDPAYLADVQGYIDTHTDKPFVVLREAFSLIASGPGFQFNE